MQKEPKKHWKRLICFIIEFELAHCSSLSTKGSNGHGVSSFWITWLKIKINIRKANLPSILEACALFVIMWVHTSDSWFMICWKRKLGSSYLSSLIHQTWVPMTFPVSWTKKQTLSFSVYSVCPNCYLYAFRKWILRSEKLVSVKECTSTVWNIIKSHIAPYITPIGNYRPNSRTKPWMYVRRSIMYEKNSCISLAEAGVRNISSVVCGFSSIKIHYSVNRIYEVYWYFLFNKISL